jgi:transposase
MPCQPRNLTDAQWGILDQLIPEPERRTDGRGRPWRPRRDVLNGILYVLRTGAPWADLPERYPPYQTCHRRFQQWVRSGVMRGVLEAVAEDLHVRGGFQLREAFIDGSFAPAKKRGSGVGKTKRGKGTKIMAVADSAGLPGAVCAESATPHEVTLVQQTLAEIFVAEPVRRLIGDNAYDSDRLDEELAKTGVEMIAPHRTDSCREIPFQPSKAPEVGLGETTKQRWPISSNAVSGQCPSGRRYSRSRRWRRQVRYRS